MLRKAKVVPLQERVALMEEMTVVESAVSRAYERSDIVARRDGENFDVVKNEFGKVGRYSPTQFMLLKESRPNARVLMLVAALVEEKHP
jgi:hypothetical protein